MMRLKIKWGIYAACLFVYIFCKSHICVYALSEIPIGPFPEETISEDSIDSENTNDGIETISGNIIFHDYEPHTIIIEEEKKGEISATVIVCCLFVCVISAGIILFFIFKKKKYILLGQNNTPQKSVLKKRKQGQDFQASFKSLSGHFKTPEGVLYAKGQLLIGRNTSCDIVLDDSQVNGIHARVVCFDGEYYLEDLDSDTGIYIEGMRIQEKNKIQTGDILSAGQCEFTLSFL